MTIFFAEASRPDSWTVAPIREAFKTTEKPRSLNPANFETVPFIPMDAIPIAGWDVSPPESRIGSSITSGTYCEDRDLLLAKITPSFENGKQAFAALDGSKFAYGTTEVIPLQAIPGKGVIEYLYSVLLHPGLRASLAGKMEGSTGRQRLGKEVLLSTSIPLPPLEEQHQIARVLATAQQAIEQQQTIIATTRELKRSLMHKLFTEGLRGEAQKQTEIGLVPESWVVAKLSDCGSIQTGVAKGRRYGDGIQTVEVPYLRVANVQAGYLDLSEMKTIVIAERELNRFLLSENDIVLTEGGDFDKLGRGFIWRGEMTQCVHQNHVFAVRVNPELVDPLFFAYQSQSPYGRRYFLSVAHKTTNLACINTTKLKAFPILLPTLSEQREIVKTLVFVDEKIDIAERKRAHLSDLVKTLLHQLMTARLRVHDLDLDALGVPPLD